MICVVNPQETTTYTLSYSVRNTQEEVNDEACYDFHDQHTGITNYYGEVTIYVSDPPAPELTIDEVTVTTNQSVYWDITNCNTSYPYKYKIMVLSDCSPEPTYDNYFYGRHSDCTYTGNGSFDGIHGSICSGQIRTKYQFFNIFNGYGSTLCKSEWTEVIVNIEDMPNPNACESDTTINNLEKMLTNSENLTREDYHFYEVKNRICDSCSVDDVFNFLVSDIKYQAPIRSDFDNPDFDLVHFLPREESQTASPIHNCDELTIPFDEFRLFALYLNFISDVVVFPNDPILVVPNYNSKCVTNYTLKGHILHPGKITRCVQVDSCNNVSIKTTGTGFHFLGPTSGGAIMSIINENYGQQIFNNLDNRLKNDFNTQ